MAQTSDGSGPVVLGVERVNNPLILPTFDALAARNDIRFTGCVLEPLPPWRVELGWPETPEDAPYLQPWRDAEQRTRYLELIKAADIVVWPGLKFHNSVRLILGRRLRRQVSVVWAERFRGRRERRWRESLAMKAVVRLLNSRNLHLMTLGEGAEQDYRDYGATRWGAWQFGYAVRAIEQSEPGDGSGRDRTLRIMFAGALRSKKRVDVLLRALGVARLARQAWRLSIVGDGKERQSLEALAAELDIASQVDFVGVVGHEAIGEVYRRSDVLVLPSDYEGWGGVVNEAMEYGLAVVASDGAGCARALISDGESGFVFRRGEVEELADCLGQFLAEPELCRTMGRAGRLRIERFRPNAVAERVARLFRGLTGYGPMPEYTEGYCKALA